MVDGGWIGFTRTVAHTWRLMMDGAGVGGNNKGCFDLAAFYGISSTFSLYIFEIA
jgi:hypothetical protein